MVEELLERAVDFVDDRATAPQIVERLTLGVQRGGAIVVARAATLAGIVAAWVDLAGARRIPPRGDRDAL